MHRFVAKGPCLLGLAAAVLLLFSTAACELTWTDRAIDRAGTGRTLGSLATGGSQVPHFVPADLPRLPGRERSGSYVADDQAGLREWQLFLVGAEGVSQVLYTTRRFLLGAEWSPDSRDLVAGYETHGEPQAPTGLNESATASPEQYLLDYAFWRGLVSFDLGTDPPTTRDELLVHGFPAILLSPDHSRAALSLPESLERKAVYVVDRAGGTLRLEGAGAQPRLYGWFPDGSGLVFTVGAADVPDRSFLYLIPLGGPGALGIEVAQHVLFGISPAWSPGGGQLAYQLVNGDLFVLDRTSGLSRLLRSNTHRMGAEPLWSRDGEHIVVGRELINTTTGEIIVALGEPYSANDAGLSPDGRYFAVAENPDLLDTIPPCTPREDQPSPSLRDNRVHVFDRRTGAAGLIQDCGQGQTGRLYWLPDGRHLVLSQQSGRHAVSAELVLVDLETSERVPLTNGRQIHASPPFHRTVRGSSLLARAYASSLLRAISLARSCLHPNSMSPGQAGHPMD